ncbi:polysaccharide deacetylase family protein [Streptomyces sp. SCSIO ZS0520]|uniref:polysaccharide deacetylase family protein n=1 Tax=Streptomyces sp. SCSIO ZS0520 TaxID=2892996 RepID=UPI0021DA47BA|nr:polysaccharide deacetylase family protein [Streptomyces sp. SCSIO ZS0520]
MGRVTTIDRRTTLRMSAAGALAPLAAGCGSTGADGPGASARTAPPGTGGASATPSPGAFARARHHAPAPGPRRFPGLPEQIERGPAGRPRIALTFHGQGAPATARALLAEAERAGARITVLAVGTWLDEYPALARRVLDGGHELGNHTQRHLDINALPRTEARAEIADCARRLRRLTGAPGTWFRPSRTRRASPLVAALARAEGYPHVLSYGVDSLDHTSPGPAAVVRTVAARAAPGAVVSLHFGHPGTVAALPALLDELARRGLKAVTTTELLS